MTTAATSLAVPQAVSRAALTRALRAKRGFDLGLLILTLPLTLALGVVLAFMVLMIEGRPIFYRARRAGQDGRHIWVWKFRTLRPGTSGSGVSGGAKLAHMSRFSAVMRRARLDELPQLFNILRGEMSFVGPRPPDLRYAAMYSDLYAQVLRLPPGLTGLATLRMHRFEGHILARCTSPEETERVYCRRCIPRKARLDLMYQRRMTRPGALLFDVWILVQSVRSVLKGLSGRATNQS